MKDSKKNDKLDNTRRRFLGVAVGASLAALVVPFWLGLLDLMGYSKKEKGAPVIIAIESLSKEGRKRIVYDGKPAHLFYEGGKPVAMSLECTHLGCIVEWKKDKRKYECPCHGGAFSDSGEVLSDPPRLPLRRLPLSIKGDKLIVGESQDNV